VRLQSAGKSAIQAPRTLYMVLASLAFLVTAVIALRFPLTATAATSGTDVYFAQTARGANNGADCADAYAYNDGTNGINKSVNWAPGDTLHVCGTISVGAGQNIISAQASGTSTSPITIQFESGAILQAPYCGTGGSSCIYLSGHNYITINGGNTGSATTAGRWTGGLVQSYANGSSGQNNCPGINNSYTGACTNQTQNVTMIEAMGSNNITIENLGPCVGAVVTGSNFPNGAPGNDCVHFQGSNVTITNNQFLWDGNGIDNTNYGNDTNTVISGNDFQENGWAIGCAGGNVTNSKYQVFSNHFHNFAGWTGTGAHVNGIHCYDGSGGGISSFYLYNNVFDGNMGTCCWTAWVYLESNGPGDNWDNNTGTVYAFNNVFVDSVGLGNASLQTGGGVNHFIANNFFYGVLGSGVCASISGTGMIVENNVFSHCGQIMAPNASSGQSPTISVMDYNVYGQASSGNSLWTGFSGMSPVSDFPAWQAACSCDKHSTGNVTTALADISSEGIPSAGYVGLQWGANLDGTATGLLAALSSGTTAGNTATPLARPQGICATQGSSSCWDVGPYYQSGASSGGQPPAPSELTASVE
jgi:hypothetical protein